MKKYVLASLATVGLFAGSAEAGLELHGKIDAGPAYVHLDNILNGKVVNKEDLWGGQLSTVTLLWKGLGVKTSTLYASGNASTLSMNSAALGFYIPVTEWLGVMPFGGFGISRYATHLDVGTPFGVVPNVKWTTNSHTPQTGLDLYLMPTDWLRISGTVAYGWSNTSSHMRDIESRKQSSQGFNYAAVVEYLLNDHWSLNAAGAWYESLSKEKHGLRAMGASLRLGYRY